MRVSVLQLDLHYNDPDKNFSAILNKIVDCAQSEEPDVIVLPEMWNVSFFPKNLEKTADEDGHRTRKFLSELSRKYRINIVGGSVAVKARNGFYNTSYTYNRQGELVHTYNKVHLFSLAEEDRHFQVGESLGVFELDGVKVGVATCYDLRFVEWIRMMALEGIEILFVPAAWPHPRQKPWKTLLEARAIENQMFVVGVNSSGRTNTLDFCGHSVVIDPLGEVLKEAQEEEAVLTTDLDLIRLKEVREEIGIYQDRRPDLYR
ncbi:Aliphatic amidase AmiE [Alkalibacterium sp. AK22]|uniref:carbon-nitrogen family hydrolase n=1 Tax=Alkalibacterium sp. AK22 TaxID=1229520 RepID=UPI00044DAB89|nr:carbon-nitrogen family hydrolase [Alkalibacterium sp. AK22]EXJ23601.1 Aliphatic amidase AmiE [Alkalibacterium sp. AK22]